MQKSIEGTNIDSLEESKEKNCPAERYPAHLSVLDMLLPTRDDASFISGQAMGDKLGLSRAAIWKAVDHLRRLGFTIDSVSSRGYRLIRSPDLLLPPLFFKELGTDRFGRDFHYYGETVSTNVTAKKLAHCLDTGSLVVAELQNQGKGRLSRKWESPPGGIYMSLFLRPDMPPQEVSRITLVMGEAISESLEEITGIPTMIKWPNDIMMMGKKICGILTWMDGDMDRVNWVIVGIGINVNIENSFFRERGLTEASSLAVLAGREFIRTELIARLLKSLEENYYDFLGGNFTDIIYKIRSRDYLRGKVITVVNPNILQNGIACGIDDDGRLILETEAGKAMKSFVVSGDVTVEKKDTSKTSAGPCGFI